MKKIYTADELAVVVLDDRHEIAVVTDALFRYIGLAGLEDHDRTAASALVGEIIAPVPS